MTDHRLMADATALAKLLETERAAWQAVTDAKLDTAIAARNLRGPEDRPAHDAAKAAEQSAVSAWADAQHHAKVGARALVTQLGLDPAHLLNALR